MNPEDPPEQGTTTNASPSYVLPVVIIIAFLVLEAAAKAIAKALASGLQDRANIEGTIAVITLLGVIAGIVLAIRTYLARKKQS